MCGPGASVQVQERYGFMIREGSSLQTSRDLGLDKWLWR